MDPWLAKQLDMYNKFFTKEQKEQHETYFMRIFDLDPEIFEQSKDELIAAGMTKMIEIGEDIIINGTGKCEPVGLLS